MQICCTKKLQQELELALQSGPEENNLFCWSVNLITINRRKTAVVVNDSNRFGFILHGLKAKGFKNFAGLVAVGIRNCLKAEKIKDEVIDQYMESTGELMFSKTRGAKPVARLNKACERASYFDDRLDLSSVYQPIADRFMNNDLIKNEKDSEYEYPHDLLIKDLELFSGRSVIRCQAADLMIKLDLEQYTAWRRAIVPIDITFKELHEIIQIAFDWKNSHLYDFNIFNASGQCILNLISEFEEIIEPREDCEMGLTTKVSISEYCQPPHKMVYCYDFGDNWEHEITINGIIDDYDKNYPFCNMGEGNAPPEDVGGVSGYEEFMGVMADPDHSEYEHYRQWAQSQWYKDFNLDMVNRRLKNCLRR